MVSDLKLECSFSSWYPIFEKDSLEATILQISDDVFKYLEHDEFVLPIEAVKFLPENAEWMDGAPVTNEEEVFVTLSIPKDNAIMRSHISQHALKRVVVGDGLSTDLSRIQSKNTRCAGQIRCCIYQDQLELTRGKFFIYSFI